MNVFDKPLSIPLVSIVGAGPGAPDLISVRGLEKVKNAKAILYDALVSTELLLHAHEDCQCIFVGKRAGKKSTPQETIHELLYQYSLMHGQVVRLKGGDPFVFGRGMEEVEYLRTRQVTVEIVPGISSATGLTSLAGIPLTTRGINQSFWVLTATNMNGELGHDLRLAAQSTAVSVILMGMRQLPIIRELYLQHKAPDTSVIIIQNGSLPNEIILATDLGSVIHDVLSSKIGTPAIIVIGSSTQIPTETIDTIYHHNLYA